MAGASEVRLVGHGGDAVRARVFRPAPDVALEPARGIVLAHDVYGVDGVDGVDAAALRLTGFGYAVIAPDLYAREGAPGPAMSDAEKALRVRSIPDRRAVADLDAACARLVEDGLAEEERVGAVGLCMGGTFVWLLGCASTRAHAVVSFYGRVVYPELSPEKPVQPLELALNLGAPFLGVFAAEDPSIPPADVERLRTVLSQAARDFDIVTYPRTRHGFAHAPRGTFDPEAAEAAWRRVREFLDERLS